MKTLIRMFMVAGVMLAATALTPTEAVAQCDWCKSTGPPVTCNAGNDPGLKCDGVWFWTLCSECDIVTSLPSAITPDGSWAPATNQDVDRPSVFLAQLGEETYEGAFVVRKDCNQAIADRWYNLETADRLKKETSVIAL